MTGHAKILNSFINASEHNKYMTISLDLSRIHSLQTSECASHLACNVGFSPSRTPMYWCENLNLFDWCNATRTLFINRLGFQRNSMCSFDSARFGWHSSHFCARNSLCRWKFSSHFTVFSSPCRYNPTISSFIKRIVNRIFFDMASPCFIRYNDGVFSVD